MKEVHYNNANYTELLHLLARHFRTPVINNKLDIPADEGTGRIWAANLNNGISLLVANITLEEPLILYREPLRAEHFQLLYNECLGEARPHNHLLKKYPHAYSLQDNLALLTNTNVQNIYIIPAGVPIKSVRIIFERKHLLDFLEETVINDILSAYFTRLIKHQIVEPLHANMRLLLHRLTDKALDAPLKHRFIEHRVSGLMEQFLAKCCERGNEVGIGLHADEITRLMKVEALLVKDFSKQPPTIEELSKVAAVSPTKLKKDFKTLYGLPVFEYFQHNRMHHARSLLLQNELSIKEVGMMVGYSNLGHFAAAFKKEFGLLPSEVSHREEGQAIGAIIA